MLLLDDQGRQAWLGTTVVIAMNLHDLALLFTPHEITSFFFFHFAEFVRSHFGKWLPCNYYVAIPFSNCYNQVNQEMTPLHQIHNFIYQLAKSKDYGRE